MKESKSASRPTIERRDLLPRHQGVRARTITTDGCFVDDFLVVERKNAVHRLNAASRGTTASPVIGDFDSS